MSSYDISGLSALVVDDSVHLCRMVRAMLNGFGMRSILEAHDGADGLERLIAFPADILIVDWEMPVLNGPEMIRMIRNPDHPLAYNPIIMLTSYSTEQRTREALQLGVNDVLSKPCSPQALYLRIVDAVVRPRPFIRSDTYFGPKPRVDLNERRVPRRPEVIDRRCSTRSREYELV